jgi:hypothetical protein
MFSRGFCFVNTAMNAQLTLADLASIKNIIEAASTRGAFRANELTVVGTMYDKLCAFVDACQAQADADKAAAEAAAAEQSPTQGEA